MYSLITKLLGTRVLLWIIVALAAALMTLGAWQQTRVVDARMKAADLRVELERLVARYAQASLEATEIERAKEQARNETTDKERNDARKKIDAAQLAADAAVHAGVRLRSALDKYVTTARRACPDTEPAERSPREPGDDPVGVLADLYRSANARTEAVGRYADQLAIVASACEKIHDPLTEESR